MDNTKTITHLSLCSGYEGIGIGLRRVLPNLREIAYVEREGFPIANLVAKMEAEQLDTAPIYTDVKTFPYRKFRGCVDMLSGGFPCQPFSAAGQRKATDDPRHLFPFIADGIKECQPRIVFLENVQGILSCTTGDGEPVLKYVLRTLEEMGYRATAGIFSASEVGAPHQRKRVFILGMADSQNIGRGGRSDRDGDNSRWVQEQETQEQPDLRSETEGCGGDTRGEELGNTNSNGHSEHSATHKEESVRGTETTTMPRSNETPELANNDSQVRRRSSPKQPVEIEVKEATRGSSIGDGSDVRYPSRPSQAQYEWEQPRVKSRLGRTTDGASNRVDRLRLLGNGVVPATAAKAFVTLIQRLK